MAPQVDTRRPPRAETKNPPAMRQPHRARDSFLLTSAHVAASLRSPRHRLTCVLFRQAGPGDKIPSIIVDDGFGPIVEVDIAERCAGQRVILLG